MDNYLVFQIVHQEFLVLQELQVYLDHQKDILREQLEILLICQFLLKYLV